jgi:hypothetical protein
MERKYPSCLVQFLFKDPKTDKPLFTLKKTTVFSFHFHQMRNLFFFFLFNKRGREKNYKKIKNKGDNGIVGTIENGSNKLENYATIAIRLQIMKTRTGRF